MDTNDIKIDKDVPLPTGQPANNKGILVRTLKSMKVGDSFLFVLNGRSFVSQRVAMYRRSETAGVTIATRNEGDGFRVWKVSDERKSR